MSPDKLFTELQSINLEAMRRKAAVVHQFSAQALEQRRRQDGPQDEISYSLTSISEDTDAIAAASSNLFAKKLTDAVHDELLDVLRIMRKEVAVEIAAEL